MYSLRQTKGRGTQGKEWISLEGNLFGTIFFPLKNNYPTFDEFSIINPVIISDTVKHFCKDKNISLKFPNDILLNGKKIGGILQETIILNDIKFLIIGMGVNLVISPNIDKDYKVTNIFYETGDKPSIIQMIQYIISSYEKFFANLHKYKFSSFKEKADTMVLN